VALSSVRGEGTVSATIGGRAGAAVESTEADGSGVATAQAADAAGASVDTSMDGNITGLTFLSIRDFESAGLAASELMLKLVAFITALVSNPWRRAGLDFSADLLFDMCRPVPLVGLGEREYRDTGTGRLPLETTTRITTSKMHVAEARITNIAGVIKIGALLDFPSSSAWIQLV
jgi:hypothetical protein